MATGPKVTTRSMSKVLDDTSDISTHFNNSNNKEKNTNITKESIPTAGTSLNPKMDIDISFVPTEEPGTQEIIFQQNTPAHRITGQSTQGSTYQQARNSYFKARKSPVGFSSDTEEESQHSTSDNEPENNIPVNKRPPREAYNKPPTDWQVEYGRKRYKMVIEANKLPGNNDTQKIRSIA